MHRFLYDIAENQIIIANRAHDRLRNGIAQDGSNNDVEILALLRGSIGDFPKLRDAGIEFGWQYAQLTRAQLVAICGDTSTSVRLFIATTHGLLVDTVFSEEQMREILERPRNLFEIPHMTTVLTTPVNGSTGSFGGMWVSDFIAIGIELKKRGVQQTVVGMVTNWRVVVDLNFSLPGILDRTTAMLTMRQLWAPLVWTEEERTRWHAMECDRVRLVAFQAQE